MIYFLILAVILYSGFFITNLKNWLEENVLTKMKIYLFQYKINKIIKFIKKCNIPFTKTSLYKINDIEYVKHHPFISWDNNKIIGLDVLGAVIYYNYLTSNKDIVTIKSDCSWAYVSKVLNIPVKELMQFSAGYDWIDEKNCIRYVYDELIDKYCEYETNCSIYFQFGKRIKDNIK